MIVRAPQYEPVGEPFRQLESRQIVAMLLEPGYIEVGLQRSNLTRFTYGPGEMALCRRCVEEWVRTSDVRVLKVSISDLALSAAQEGTNGEIELLSTPHLADARVGSLMSAVNAERIAGFPSGRLFLDSVEQALAAVLVDGHSVRPRPVKVYGAGLSPARFRRVLDVVQAKLGDEITLDDMAGSAGLSRAHFSRMFRQTTGESPHQFVLRHRIELAQKLLRAPDARVLDVALTCGFKTQQHFARAFRRACGVGPTEYRCECVR